jgi:hypothetical protein
MPSQADVLAFTATPTEVFVNCAVPPTNTDNLAVVTYEVRSEYFQLWERLNSGPWVLVDLAVRARIRALQDGLRPEDDTPEFRERLLSAGRFNSPFLAAGSFYEVRMFDTSRVPFDPNVDGDRQFLRSVEVFGLCATPSGRPLLNDRTFEVGGTFAVFTAFAADLTRMKSWAGTTAPVADGRGGFVLDRPEATSTSAGLSVIHSHELTPLRPGTDYFLLVRLSDRLGNWEFVPMTVRTKRRLCIVTYDLLRVFNDGDPGSAGNAYYDLVTVEEPGTAPGERLYARFPPTGELVLGDGASASLGVSHIFGPKNLMPGAGAIRVFVRGHDVDREPWPLPDSEETASNFDGAGPATLGVLGTYLDIPFGRGTETVLGARRTINTAPEAEGDDFVFAIDVLLTIHYV